ncbi:MAG: DUF427 domain-containing protein [Calditrichaeota bacterium]|nr:MAG: DUF427 domain-containing protein [Calditrichota bacterium]
MKAIWNNTVIAQSDATIVVEGNHYFPPDSVNKKWLVESDTRTICPWKGQAHYYTIKVGSEENKDAAWYYPKTSEAARPIENYIAFWRGVHITED